MPQLVVDQIKDAVLMGIRNILKVNGTTAFKTDEGAMATAVGAKAFDQAIHVTTCGRMVNQILHTCEF